MSSGRRRIRSATSPVTGASRRPAENPKNTSPAALLLPVRIFTQMPMASHSALSPMVDSAWPPR